MVQELDLTIAQLTQAQTERQPFPNNILLFISVYENCIILTKI